MNYLPSRFVGTLLVSICALTACHHQKSSVTTSCPETGGFVKQAKDANGTVYYDSTRSRYGIQASTSFDSADMGLTCNLPKEYQKQMMKVRFNGSYYAYDKPVNVPAGYNQYYLTIDSISKRE